MHVMRHSKLGHMPSRRCVFRYAAIIVVAIELCLDLSASFWGFCHVLKGDNWGWQPVLIAGLRGVLFLLAAHYALRGYSGARTTIVVFDAMEAVLGLPMAFLGLVINNGGHGVRNFIMLLSVSAFFGLSAWFVAVGLRPMEAKIRI